MFLDVVQDQRWSYVGHIPITHHPYLTVASCTWRRIDHSQTARTFQDRWSRTKLAEVRTAKKVRWCFDEFPQRRNEGRSWFSLLKAMTGRKPPDIQDVRSGVSAIVFIGGEVGVVGHVEKLPWAANVRNGWKTSTGAQTR